MILGSSLPAAPAQGHRLVSTCNRVGIRQRSRPQPCTLAIRPIDTPMTAPNQPRVASSLTFLRRTPWAREKVESLYLFMLRDARRDRSD